MTSKTELYRELETELGGLLAGESDRIANAANMAALLFYRLPEINWLGFYFLAAEELVVGPFQGKPACVRIPLGKGVCGTAAAERRALVVEDVHCFAGHIACDPESRSELVIPVLQGERLVGVLDVDSPRTGRFDAADREGLERLVQIYVAATG